jgi:hypothetical protein
MPALKLWYNVYSTCMHAFHNSTALLGTEYLDGWPLIYLYKFLQYAWMHKNSKANEQNVHPDK